MLAGKRMQGDYNGDNTQQLTSGLTEELGYDLGHSSDDDSAGNLTDEPVDELAGNISNLSVAADSRSYFNRLKEKAAWLLPQWRKSVNSDVSTTSTPNLTISQTSNQRQWITLADELQQLADQYQELTLIKLVSGLAEIFIPKEVAVTQSKLLAILSEDLADELSHSIELPISSNYADALLKYAIYLGSLDNIGVTPRKRATSRITASESLVLVFLRQQAAIITNHMSLTELDSDPYLQLELASYLEDFTYFRAIMRELYKIWPQLVLDGPVSEVNYDIYTFTPWPYLPANLITSPSFVKLWIERNVREPEDRYPKSITLDNDVSYSSFRNDYQIRKNMIVSTVSVVPSRSSHIARGTRAEARVEDINLYFYPDSSLIKREEVIFREPIPYLFHDLNQKSKDRILYTVTADLKDDEINLVFKMVSYWTKRGKLVKRDYFIVSHDSYYNAFLLLTPYTGPEKISKVEHYNVVTVEF